MKCHRHDPAATSLHVAIVNLAFERTATASDLLTRYPLLTNFVTHLAATGDVRVTVLGRFWCDEDVEAGGVQYHFRADSPTRRVASPLTRPVALYDLLRDLRADVVHVNGLVFPLHVVEMRWRLPATTTLIVQHHGERPYSRPLTWANRAARACVDGFLFSTDRIADEWRSAGAIGPRQLVLPVLEASSLFTSRSYEESRRQTRMHGDPAVLWVGRLHPRKAPLLALEAFDRARDRLRDPHLFLVFHEDQLLLDVRAFCASRAGLADRVHLVGAVPHARLEAWFSAADLFITSSPAEGSNVALLESLSCGLLPVCSDNPANRLATGGGHAGLLFPCGDAARAADAIVEAAARAALDADARYGCGPEAAREAERTRLRAYFDAHLGWPVIAREAVSAYHTAVAWRRDRRRLA